MTQEAELSKAKAKRAVLIHACDLRAVIFIALALLKVGSDGGQQVPTREKERKKSFPLQIKITGC